MKNLKSKWLYSALLCGLLVLGAGCGQQKKVPNQIQGRNGSNYRPTISALGTTQNPYPTTASLTIKTAACASSALWLQWDMATATGSLSFRIVSYRNGQAFKAYNLDCESQNYCISRDDSGAIDWDVWGDPGAEDGTPRHFEMGDSAVGDSSSLAFQITPKSSKLGTWGQTFTIQSCQDWFD